MANLSVASDYPGTDPLRAWEEHPVTLVERLGMDYWLGAPPSWANNGLSPSVAFSFANPRFPAMAFYVNGPSGSVLFTKSEDYANNFRNWATPAAVAGVGGPTGPQPSTMPALAIDAFDRIHLAYLRTKMGGGRDVYYLENDARGRDDAWMPEPGVRLSSGGVDNHDLVIAASWQGQTVVAVWTATQASGDDDLQYAYSLDGGSTWHTGLTLATTPYHEGYPAIAVDLITSTFNVAYWRDDSAPGHQNNILYTQASAGDPGNWTNPQSVVDSGAVVSDTYRRPAVVSYWRGGTDNVVSVAWTDARNPTTREDLYMTDVDLVDCSATGTPSSGVAPLSVSFDASANGGLPPYSFQWRFGDGATGAGPTLAHTYAQPGLYGASVQVTDMAGNVCFVSIAIDALSPLPDLAVRPADVSLSPPPYVEGRPIWANATVRNLGGGNATDVTVRLALGSPAGLSLGNTTVTSIPALGNASVSFPWTPPSAGAYTLCVVADPDNAIPESNEGNNAACITVDVLVQPDLAFLAGDLVATPASVPLGGTVNLTATLRNLGGSSAANVLVTFLRDGNGNRLPDPGEVFDAQTVTSLAGGATTSLGTSWIAGDVGPQTLCAYADPNDAIPEGDETNNVDCASVTVLGPPDYVPWGPQPPSPITVGLVRPVSLSVNVRNVGDAPANVTTRLVFFNASTPSNPFSSFDVPPLGAGEIAGPFNARWTSPGVPGMYAVSASVDAGNAVAEGNESNNVYTWSVRVVPGPVTTILVGSPNVTAGMTYVTSATPLSFSVLDQSGTGIRNTTYRVDGGPWVNYTATGPFTLAGEGPHLVEWSSEDFARNVEPIANATLVVDDTPPTATLAVGDPMHVSADTYVTSATPLTIAAADGGMMPVGVASVEYGIDGAWATYAGPFTLAGDGPHTVEYRSSDRLGNTEASRTLTLVVDNTASTTLLSVGAPKSLVGGTFVNGSTPITLAATDGGVTPVGLGSMSLRIWSGMWAAWAPYGLPFTLSGADGTRYVEYRSADRLGNQEPVRNATLVLDDTPPTTTFAPVTGPYTTATTFTLSVVDAGSGVNGTEVRIDGGAWTPYAAGFALAAGDHTLSYRSADRLGNREPERTRAIHVEGLSPPAAVNLKPLVASVFTTILVLLGAWSARRAPWPTGSRRRLHAFVLAALPFVVAESATGITSYFTGLLAIPPLLGVGTAVDVAILVIGIATSVRQVRRWTPPK